jgi:PAS domain-containing protein
MPEITDNGRGIGFPDVNSDGAAANIAASDLINILDSVDVPIVVLRSDRTLVWFNKAATVLGLLPSDIGRAFRDIQALTGVPGLEGQCNKVVASGLESETDFRDEDKWFGIRISPYTKDDGQVSGIVLTFTNGTALRASIDQIIYERECTKAILNAVADPLVVLSADQRIHCGNRAFYEMFLELASLRTQLKEMLEGGRGFEPVEVDHVFPGEGQRTLSIDAHRLTLPGHPERRILMTFQDITARKQAEASNDLRAIAARKEELRRSEAFLAEAQRLSLTGSFSWRVTTQEITWSDQLYRIYELEIGVPVTLELIRTRVHPEDLASYEKMIEEVRNRGMDFEYEYRLRMPDRSIKYLHVVARGTRDEDGRLEYIGAVQDVTARRTAFEMG